MVPHDGRTKQQKGYVSHHADRQQGLISFIAPETITYHEKSHSHCYVGHIERQWVARPMERETNTDAHKNRHYRRYAPLNQEASDDTYEKER